jgi:hypothetical protein
MAGPLPPEQVGAPKAVFFNFMLQVDDQADPLGPFLAGLPHQAR